MKSSYFMPKDEMKGFVCGLAMNKQEGIFLNGLADPSIKDLLPPPLELADPLNPLFYLYAVNIKMPSFTPGYQEGGIGVLAKYGDIVGMYFFNVMLCGPGALMGAYIGRETSGLPKKLCDAIVIEREGRHAQCHIERKGVRLLDVEMEVGSYNFPEFKMEQEESASMPEGLLTGGGCLLHRYTLDEGTGARDMELINYDSPTRYYSWEPASATVKLSSSIDDPYGEVPLTTVLGAAWARCDNWIAGNTVIHRYPDEEAADIMQYLFAGRYDQGVIVK